jgi:hypothetical protein
VSIDARADVTEVLAEQAGVAYSFQYLEGMSWSENPALRSRSGRKR